MLVVKDSLETCFREDVARHEQANGWHAGTILSAAWGTLLVSSNNKMR